MQPTEFNASQEASPTFFDNNSIGVRESDKVLVFVPKGQEKECTGVDFKASTVRQAWSQAVKGSGDKSKLNNIEQNLSLYELKQIDLSDLKPVDQTVQNLSPRITPTAGPEEMDSFAQEVSDMSSKLMQLTAPDYDNPGDINPSIAEAYSSVLGEAREFLANIPTEKTGDEHILLLKTAIDVKQEVYDDMKAKIKADDPAAANITRTDDARGPTANVDDLQISHEFEARLANVENDAMLGADPNTIGEKGFQELQSLSTDIEEGLQSLSDPEGMAAKSLQETKEKVDSLLGEISQHNTDFKLNDFNIAVQNLETFSKLDDASYEYTQQSLEKLINKTEDALETFRDVANSPEAESAIKVAEKVIADKKQTVEDLKELVTEEKEKGKRALEKAGVVEKRSDQAQAADANSQIKDLRAQLKSVEASSTKIGADAQDSLKKFSHLVLRETKETVNELSEDLGVMFNLLNSGQELKEWKQATVALTGAHSEKGGEAQIAPKDGLNKVLTDNREKLENADELIESTMGKIDELGHALQKQAAAHAMLAKIDGAEPNPAFLLYLTELHGKG